MKIYKSLITLVSMLWELLMKPIGLWLESGGMPGWWWLPEMRWPVSRSSDRGTLVTRYHQGPVISDRRTGGDQWPPPASPPSLTLSSLSSPPSSLPSINWCHRSRSQASELVSHSRWRDLGTPHHTLTLWSLMRDALTARTKQELINYIKLE